LNRLGQRFLKHIGGIHAWGHARIQPQRHHAPQSLVMAIQQLAPRGAFPLGGALEQRFGIRFCTGHRSFNLYN
jgi:hypothetical protein